MLKGYCAAMTERPLTPGPVGDETNSWLRKAVLLTATAAVNAQEELLTRQKDTEPEMWRNLVMNRILRGVLWTVSNGDAPGRGPFDAFEYGEDDRSFECSLSYKQLERVRSAKETVCIS